MSWKWPFLWPYCYWWWEMGLKSFLSNTSTVEHWRNTEINTYIWFLSKKVPAVQWMRNVFKLNQNITTDYYSCKLIKFKEILVNNRPSLMNIQKNVFYHDNARPHIAIIALSKLRELIPTIFLLLVRAITTFFVIRDHILFAKISFWRKP